MATAAIRRRNLQCHTLLAMRVGGAKSDGESNVNIPAPVLIMCHGDRELPHCTVCERTMQTCEYPARILKPGPKIGSTQRSRKRRRADAANDNEAAKTNLIAEGSSTVAARKSRISSQEEIGDNAQGNISTSGMSPGQTSSKTGTVSQETLRHHSINIHDLSFSLHPAHEDSTSEKNASPRSPSDGLGNARDIMASRASYALGVTSDALEKMIKIFFDNMTAINIFHEPTFEDMVRNISSVAQVHALLASMLAFSARFCTPGGHDGQACNFDSPAEMAHKPGYFFELALRFANEALRECGDEAPPLCVVQALALIAHGQLTQGVRGKAWRSLGTCVRLAYELNLHLVDAAHPREVVDARQWCDNEEKRRVWWAIWEMDVFASTVRRCPTAVDWSQIETLLPVEDDHWFTSKPQASCFLEIDPVRRWKALQDSGNHSPKAWYIVINSLMKEAQSISSPRGIPNPSSLATHRLTVGVSKDQKNNAAIVEEVNEKLEVLMNAVYCFVMALPPHLRYRNQYLGFDARQPGQTSSLRQQHCGIYNIHVMTELTKLMIHHYYIFGESARECRTTRDKQTGKSDSSAIPSRMNSSDNMNQYFEAADEILKIIRRSSDDHIQWINNFLSSTIWLASAVQLVHKEFGPPGTNRSLIKSKFEVLNMTYKKCVSFWAIQTAMQRNLETLELQLELFRTPVSKKPDNIQQKAHRIPQTPRGSWTNDLSLPVTYSDTQNKRTESQSVNGLSSQSKDRISSDPRGSSNLCSHSHQQSTLPNNPKPITPVTAFPFQDDHFQSHEQPQSPPQRKSQHQSQIPGANLAPLSPALSVLDFMYFSSQTDADVQHQAQHMDGGMSVSPSYTTDQEGIMYSGVQESQYLGMNNDPLQGLSSGMHTNGWNMELPNYIDELLSGACLN